MKTQEGLYVVQKIPSWISSELEPDFTSSLLEGEPWRDYKTVEIAIPGLDGKNLIELSAGGVHEFGFQALDDLGKPRCLGRDYFEKDLSGESWKSRPLVKDFSTGSYSISLQVHPDFDGVYNLTITLLYRRFEGLLDLHPGPGDLHMIECLTILQSDSTEVVISYQNCSLAKLPTLVGMSGVEGGQGLARMMAVK